jgi:hypothetical protein
MMHNRMFGAIGLAMGTAAAIAQEAPMTPLQPDQVALLAAYKELVETNTALSAASRTLATDRCYSRSRKDSLAHGSARGQEGRPDSGRLV